SWAASADPPLPPGSRQACALGDPAVGIDRLGRQYYALLVALPCDLANLGGAAGTPQLFVARRANATAAWVTSTRPVAPLYPGDALRPGEADDKPALAVDVSVTSPHTNREYVVWTRSGGAEAHRILLGHSDDGASTWSTPVRANERPLSGSALASVA